MANGTFGGGNGSATSPYVIQDVADFRAMNGKAATYYYVLGNDIDFASAGTIQPIQTSGATYHIYLNGNGFTLRNMTINQFLFKGHSAWYCSIQNVTFENCTSTMTNSYSSLLFDYYYGKCDVKYCNFINCTVTNTDPNYSSGLISVHFYEGTISNNKAVGCTVQANGRVGGVAQVIASNTFPKTARNNIFVNCIFKAIYGAGGIVHDASPTQMANTVVNNMVINCEFHRLSGTANQFGTIVGFPATSREINGNYASDTNIFITY